jgi:hypothetical protein
MPTQHIEEEVLDRYAMGVLSGESIADVEEHLLICAFCQSRLLETDEFLIVFRAAATQVDAHPAPAWRRLLARGPVLWAGTATAAAALLVFLIAGQPHKTTLPAAVVLMQSLRGPEAGAHIASGRPGLLVFDLPVQTAGANYQVEIVDAIGNEIVSTGTGLRDGKLTVLLEKLARGAYWVRVYRRQAGRELIAEYGLQSE